MLIVKYTVQIDGEGRIFSVLKNGVSFPMLIVNKKHFLSMFFWLFIFAINL